MSTRSFLLLGFASPNAVYAADCTADEIAGIDISNLSTGECTVPSLDASSRIIETFCAQDGCFQDLKTFVETAEFPDCEVLGQNFKELTEIALGVIVNSYEAQCPGNIVYDGVDGEDSMAPDGENTLGGENTLNPGGGNTLGDEDSMALDGEDEDTPYGKDTPYGEDYETPASDESEDTSDAHGWSAAHYMLATVLPMALLWV